MLKHPSPQIKLAAARALIGLWAEPAAKATLLCLQRHPEIRHELLVALLGARAEDFNELVKRLPLDERRETLLDLVALLGRQEPDMLRGVLAGMVRREKEPGRQSPVGEHVALALDSFIRALPRVEPLPLFEPDAADLTFSSGKAAESGSRLFGQMKKMLGKGKAEAPAGDPFPTSVLERLAKGEQHCGKSFKDREQPGPDMARSRYERVTFANADLRGANVHSTVFVGCKLDRVDLSQSRFQDALFEDCSLKDCWLGSGRALRLRLERCRLERTHFEASLVEGFEAVDCFFHECNFSGAAFRKASLRSCELQACSFALFSLRDARIQGAMFADCRFDRTFLGRIRLDNVETMGAHFSECSFHDVRVKEPWLMAEAERSRRRALLASLEDRPRIASPPALGSEEGVQLMFQLLSRWFFEQDSRSRLQGFLANNQRRLEWAECMLDEPKNRFLKILPGLLLAGVRLTGQGPKASTPCSIQGYTPDYQAATLLREHLPGGEAAGLADSAPAVAIEGLYLIGSTGTIAQAKSSDLDFWVCCDLRQTSAATQRELKAKLDDLERWAEQRFGLETHFFLMDLRSVRENDFGFSDEESSGSTQALLLKEEFYRTVIVLAGKTPAWWCFPWDIGPTGYQAHLARLAEAVTLRPDDLLDLGHLAAVPRAEFLGASLWQIVKAMKSPFKSVMKFALLEKYITGHNVDVLLCNRIKENLMLGEHDLWDVDPYAVLFREVFEFYRQRGDEDAQNLMRLSFNHKTGLQLTSQPTGRAHEMRGYSFMEFFFPFSENPMTALIEPTDEEVDKFARGASAFSELLEIGDMIREFMIETYRRILEATQREDTRFTVTKEDLTKMGRKIFSHIRQRQHKVMRIPFVDPPKNLFQSLQFECLGKRGSTFAWAVNGQTHKRKGKKAELELIQRDDSIERMCAWLIANKMYAPGAHILASSIEFPVSVEDIHDLLDKMYDALPYDQTFNTNVQEALQAEQVVHGFLVMNFTVPREEKAIREVAIVFSTNWGELFCLPTTTDVGLLAQGPREFLKRNIDIPLRQDASFRMYSPPKSALRRLNLEIY